VIERRDDKICSICSGVSSGFTGGWSGWWDIGRHVKDRRKGADGNRQADPRCRKGVKPASRTVNLPSALDPNENPEQRKP